MVSIRESITELERIHELQSASLECYRSAIQAIASYSVDFDAGATESLRRDLSALSSDLRGNVDVPRLLATRCTLRDELRDYREKGLVFLSGLREELSEKARALDVVVDALANADSGHEERLRESLGKLRELSESPQAGSIRATLLAISDQLAQSIEEMKQEMKLTIGQFRVEIKMLHSQVEALQTAPGKNSGGQFKARLEMEALIAEEIDARHAFSLCLMKIRNLAQIERQFGAEARADAITSFAAAVNNILPKEAMIGRWNDDQFVAMARIEKSDAVVFAKRLTQHLAEGAQQGENGRPHRPAPQLSIAVLVNAPADTRETLFRKIDTYL